MKNLWKLHRNDNPGTPLATVFIPDGRSLGPLDLETARLIVNGVNMFLIWLEGGEDKTMPVQLSFDLEY